MPTNAYISKATILAAIFFIFNKFVNDSRKLYELSECVTVDEILLKFRGRSDKISYMPKKPGKYGLVIRVLCDAKISFLIVNMFIPEKALMVSD